MKTKYVIVGFLSVILFFYFISLLRKKQLVDTELTTLCKVEDIRESYKGVNRTITKYALIVYYLDNKKYNTSFNLKEGVEIGNCYEMIYSSKNPKNIKIYFDKQVDCSKIKE